MNKIAAAVALSLAVAQTAASAAVPPQVASTTGSEARIAPVAGSQDGDLTLEGFEGIAGAYLYSEEVVPVGPVLADAEKDTLARTVVGTDCR